MSDKTIRSMTVAELRAALAPYPDDMAVILSVDAEGNEYKPIEDVEVSHFWGVATDPDHPWILHLLWHGPEDGSDPGTQHVPVDQRAVVIGPVN